MSTGLQLQIIPGYTSPEKCPNGCARWDNLAADGNTTNQQEINKLWAGGAPPPDAGNQCARYANMPNMPPLCLCAGTNDASYGNCQPPTSLDLQVVPGYIAPKCPEGCARWDNLAADGNKSNQEEANRMWAGGAPPPDAGNQCVISPYLPGSKPFCYCKNGEKNSQEICEDRNTTANVCRSTPNGMDELSNIINNCTTTTEFNRNMNFAEKTFNINKDIETLQALVADSLVMGDTVFGKAGVGEITKQVQARHKELTAKKEHLKAEIDKKEAIVERSNRDFEDVKSRVPDPQPKRVLNVLEDYTMAFLVISYLFMILAGIYVFTAIAQVKVAAFFKALGGSVVLTIFMFMVVYYLT